MRARSGVNCGLQTGMVATTKVVVCNYPTASHQMGQQTTGHLRCLRHNFVVGPDAIEYGVTWKELFLYLVCGSNHTHGGQGAMEEKRWWWSCSQCGVQEE